MVRPNEPSPSAFPGGPSPPELLFDSLWRSWILCQRWMYVFWYFKTSSQCSRLLPRVNIDPPRVENPIGLSARKKLDELFSHYLVQQIMIENLVLWTLYFALFRYSTNGFKRIDRKKIWCRRRWKTLMATNYRTLILILQIDHTMRIEDFILGMLESTLDGDLKILDFEFFWP